MPGGMARTRDHGASDSKMSRQSTAGANSAQFGWTGICILTLVYALNIVDRYIVNILAEPIKRDLQISDQQLGLLIGLSFAIFYSLFGLPIARLSEKHDRRWIVTICLLTWSGFTMLCGAARNFTTLLTIRVGVAIGEAGCLPAAQSLISDYVPASRRATAMAVLIAGSPLGVLLGMGIGGVVAQHYGWRVAFVVAGAPGILLASVTAFALRDPRRNLLLTEPAPGVSFLAAMRILFASGSFWLMAIGAGFGAFASYSQNAFLAPFLLRVHGQSIAAIAGPLGQEGFVGITLGLIMGAGGMVGMVLGGRIADWRSPGDPAGYMSVSGAVSFLAAPFLIAALSMSAVWPTLLILIPFSIFNSGWAGPYYAGVLAPIPPELRSTAAAVGLLTINLIGLGLGPLCIGTLSDILARSMGSAEGIRWALGASAGANILAGVIFLLARRTLKKDARGV
jgi:predicted MFS family arabinose efflux permease